MSEVAPRTWDDVSDWDDLVPLATREIISGLKIDGNSCSALKREGEYFYYCENLANQLKDVGEFTDKPGLNSLQYKAHMGTTDLQLYCTDCDRRKKCIFFEEER